MVAKTTNRKSSLRANAPVPSCLRPTSSTLKKPDLSAPLKLREFAKRRRLRRRPKLRKPSVPNMRPRRQNAPESKLNRRPRRNV